MPGAGDDPPAIAVSGKAVAIYATTDFVMARKLDRADLRRQCLQTELETALAGSRNAAHQARVNAARFAGLQGDDVAETGLPVLALYETDKETAGALVDKSSFAGLKASGSTPGDQIHRAMENTDEAFLLGASKDRFGELEVAGYKGLEQIIGG